jgi:phosphate transport system permease protein
MDLSTLFLIIIALAFGAYFLGFSRSYQIARPLGGISKLPALPTYYGFLMAIWALVPALLVLAIWLLLDDIIIRNLVVAELPQAVQALSTEKLSLVVNNIQNVASGAIAADAVPAEYGPALEKLQQLNASGRIYLPLLSVLVLVIGGLLGLRLVRPSFHARLPVEKAFNVLLFLCSSIAIVTTAGIVFSVIFESMRFFSMVPVSEFLFGLEWSPQIAIRADQAGASGSFGMLPLFAGTMLISFLAMTIAVPVGLMSAIYLAEYADRRLRGIVKPALEILAGIPTVVYGFFAALTVAPFVRDAGAGIGLDVSSESALAAGLVMGIMIIPFVSSLSDDVINAVPQSLRDGSFGLGATKSETIRQVIIPAALPGIVGGVLLAVSRAIGETMIVVMAAGLAANLTANPLDAVTTVTVQIVTLLVGDQEFDSPKTLAAFALGLMLFVVTLSLNFIALHVVRKYREQYE